MIFYLELLILLIGGGIALFLRKTNNPYLRSFLIAFLIFFGALMIATAGLRTDYGRDLDNYRHIFDHTVTWLQTVHYPLEKGYLLLNFIFNQLGASFETFVLCVAFVSLTIRFWLIKKFSPLPILSVILYFLLYFINNEMGQMRNSLAEVVFLLGFFSLLQGGVIKFAISLITAMLLHVSAGAAVIVVFFKNMKPDLRFLITSIVIAFLVGSVNFIDLATWLAKVLGSGHLINKLIIYSGESVSAIGAVAYRLIILLTFWFMGYNAKKDDHRLLLIGYWLSIILLLGLRSVPMLAIRSANLFKALEVFIIPHIFMELRHWNRLTTIKRSMLLFLVFFMIAYCSMIFYRVMIFPEYFNYILLGI